ncbi:hypothetical protein ACTFRP_05085, partial [Bacillus cereus group sp. MYBK234-1]
SSVTSCLLYGLLIANHLQYVFDSSLTDILLSCRHYLDTAVMLANLFIAHLKIKDKGVFYKERVKALHHDIYKNL